MKPVVLETQQAATWSYTVIVPDPCAGKSARYTVWRLSARSGGARIIGRELPLNLAQQVAARDESASLYQLGLLITAESYYRQNARAVWRARQSGRAGRFLGWLLFWRRMPREGFFQFEDTDAW